MLKTDEHFIIMVAVYYLVFGLLPSWVICSLLAHQLFPFKAMLKLKLPVLGFIAIFLALGLTFTFLILEEVVTDILVKHNLLERGQQAPGHITKELSGKGKDVGRLSNKAAIYYNFEYTFTTTTGITTTGRLLEEYSEKRLLEKTLVARLYKSTLQIGMSLTVTYLPENPSVSVPYTMGKNLVYQNLYKTIYCVFPLLWFSFSAFALRSHFNRVLDETYNQHKRIGSQSSPN